MAGHSKFANIKHRKSAQDAKKAKLFTRLLRDVYIAAKGGPDPSFNAALRTALLNARGVGGVPKDRIDAAITRASSVSDNDSALEYIRYNAKVNNASLIIEVLSDNRNRSVADLKSVLLKHDGHLIPNGGIEFMFDHIGSIMYPIKQCTLEQLVQLAIEANALDAYSKEDCHIIETKPNEMHRVEAHVTSIIGDPQSSNLIWKPKTFIEDIDTSEREHITRAVDLLEDLDDVQCTYANVLLQA